VEVATAVVAVLLVAGVAALLFGRVARLKREGVSPAWVDPTSRAGLSRPVPAHGRLAEEGRFAEAIHALLLRAMADLSSRTDSAGRATSPAKTSREILRSSSLAPELRRALAPLVAAVERAYFGTGLAGLEEYAQCVREYRSFETACKGRT